MMGSMMRRAMIGDSATLNVDFTSMTNGGQLANAGFTFTNATTTARTYINSNGVLATATTNEPRFDHDPTTLAPRGLLVEGTSTNLATYSNLQAAWLGGINRTVTPNTTDVLSPDGTNNAAKVALTSASYCSVYEAIVGLANATTYTFSYWIRGTAGNQQRIYSLTQGADLVTQTTLTYTNTGWTRIQVTFTSGAANNTVFIYPVSRASGTVNDVLYVYGCQLEAGNGASSLIPTGASTVQRLADECSMTGTNFSSWFNATEGTFLAHARRIRTTDLGRIVSANDNTTTESIDLGADTTGEFIVTDGGSALATISPGTVTANTAFKIAGAYKLNDVQAALGGTLGTADTSVTLPTIDRLMVGRQAGGSPIYLNGTVAVLKYWPTRLTNAQLQSFTT
jgi:hypothetical protein